MRVRAFLVVVAAAGLVLLVACGGGGEQSTSTATPSASAEDGGELTREQAIQRVLEMLEAAPDQHADPSTATARRLTECEALDIMRWQGVPWGASPTPASESPVWLVEVRGEFSGFIGYGLTPDPSPPVSGRFLQIVQLDGSFGAAAGLPDERTQHGPELSQESILERALDEVAPPRSENQPDPSTAILSRTTFREALEALRREGAPQDLSERANHDDPVWLFEVSGQFIDFCSLLRPGKYLLVLALDGFVESSGFIPDDTATPVPGVELTREQAIERAFELLANYLFYRPDASAATATRLTYGEALETVRREGGLANGPSGLASDLPVWLVEVRGARLPKGEMPEAPGTHVFIINLHGASEYDELILDATPTP